MSRGIVLWPDTATDAAIEDLWDALAALWVPRDGTTGDRWPSG